MRSFFTDSAFKLFSLLTICFVVSGCGGGNAEPPQAAEVAGMAESTVNSFLKTARKNPKTAGSEASILLESLEALANDYGAPYDALLEQGRVVESKYQSNAPKAEIETELKKLEEMVSAPATS